MTPPPFKSYPYSTPFFIYFLGLSMKKNISIRTRSWSIILYEDPSVVFSSLLSISQHHAYIFHDKDDVAPHYHMLVLLPNAKTQSAVMSYFAGCQNVLFEPIRDRYQAFRYLTHKDNPEKYQYPDELVQKDNDVFWTNLTDAPTARDGESALQMLNDILDRKPFSYMVLTYGRDYLRYKRIYDECALYLRAELYGLPSDPTLPLVSPDDPDYSDF